MAQTVSSSLNTKRLGPNIGNKVEHNGLASGETAYLGALMTLSGSVGAGTFLYLATGSNSTHQVAGVVTRYDDQNAGTAASSNGDNSAGLVIENGIFAFENGNPDTAVPGLANEADVGKLVYATHGDHCAVSGTLTVVAEEAPIAGRVVKISLGKVWVDLTKNTAR